MQDTTVASVVGPRKGTSTSGKLRLKHQLFPINLQGSFTGQVLQVTSGADVRQSTEVCGTLPDPLIPIGRVGVPSFRSCIFHCSENRGMCASTRGTGIIRCFFC